MLPPRASGRSHPRRSRSQKSSAFFARGPIPPIFVFRRIMKSGRPVQYHEWLPSDAVFGCLLWRVGLLGRLSALVSTPRDPAIPWGSPPHFRTPGSPSLPSVQTEAAPGALWPMRQGGDSCCRNHPQLPARPSVAADTRPAELCARAYGRPRRVGLKLAVPGEGPADRFLRMRLLLKEYSIVGLRRQLCRRAGVTGRGWGTGGDHGASNRIT